MTVVSFHGMHTHLVGDEGLTPLFRAVRVKKGWFGNPKVVGVQDAAEAFAPGVVPRPGPNARKARSSRSRRTDECWKASS